MMGLIGDDSIEFLRIELRKAPFGFQGLHRSRHDLFSAGTLPGLLDAKGAIVVAGWLANELIAMRDDQNTPIAGDTRERHRLAEPRCHLHKMASALKGIYRIDALFLIIAQLNHSEAPLLVFSYPGLIILVERMPHYLRSLLSRSLAPMHIPDRFSLRFCMVELRLTAHYPSLPLRVPPSGNPGSRSSPSE